MCNCSDEVVKAKPQEFNARVLSRLPGGSFLVMANARNWTATDRSGRAAPGLTMTLSVVGDEAVLV